MFDMSMPGRWWMREIISRSVMHYRAVMVANVFNKRNVMSAFTCGYEFIYEKVKLLLSLQVTRPN